MRRWLLFSIEVLVFYGGLLQVLVPNANAAADSQADAFRTQNSHHKKTIAKVVRHRSRRAVASTIAFDFSVCQNLNDASSPQYQECINHGCYKPLDIENAGLVCPDRPRQSNQDTPAPDLAE